MTIDKRSGQKVKHEFLPPEKPGADAVREEIPEGDLGKWIRKRAASLEAKRCYLSKLTYNQFRESSKQRSSSVSWVNGCGLCMVLPGKGVKAGEACFE